LGINLLPSGVKICNFDCLYCQCGWTHRRQLAEPESIGFPSLEDLRREVAAGFKALCEKGINPDTIVFSGNGEPTLHPSFKEAAEIVRQYRDQYLPSALLSILTNGSRLLTPPIHEAVEQLDLKCLKLDAGNLWMDRPFMAYDLEELIPAWRALTNLTVQSFFCAGRFANTSHQWVEPWLDQINRINPARLQIYTLDRHAPVALIEKAPESALLSIAATAKEWLAIDVQVFA
jgi:wyosine [tRNA(Phe)-imidazoG37] synthetase (radical SAM superfamily)